MAGHGHVDTHGDKRIALLIAILALCLAVVETGAKSSQTEALTRNVEAANLWAFFQARTIRQTNVRTAAEQAELQREAFVDRLAPQLERRGADQKAEISRREAKPPPLGGKTFCAEAKARCRGRLRYR